MAAKTVSLSIKVTPEEKMKVQELAGLEGVTVSKLLYNYLFEEKNFWAKYENQLPIKSI